MDNTILFDFSPHDSMVWYAENGWDVNDVEIPYDEDAIILIKENPNNPYEIIFEKTDDLINRQLYKYNFCTNTRTLLLSPSHFKFDWTKKDKIYFFRGFDLFRMNNDATNEEYIYTASSNTDWIESSPNGSLLLISQKSELNLFTIITENGEEVSNLNGNGTFLGWLDYENILIQYNGEVRKVNIYNEIEEFYLIGEFDFYNSNLKRFLKKILIDGFENWQIINKHGAVLSETDSHLWAGFHLSYPIFLDENRIISRYLSREYNQSLNTMLMRSKAIIMNLDGSNARRVTAFE